MSSRAGDPVPPGTTDPRDDGEEALVDRRLRERDLEAEESRQAAHEQVDEQPAPEADTAGPEPEPGFLTRDDLRATRSRQREEFGGIKWGSAFFGWLVSIGVAALAVGVVSAAGAATGLTDDSSGTGTIGIASGILLLVIIVVAYYAGGYVAGRLSRFDGARQGLAVWLLGLAVTLILAAAGALLGAEYNVLEQLNLPRVPVDEGTVTTGAAIALAAAVGASLLGAMAGGKLGERYHRKIDRIAVARPS